MIRSGCFALLLLVLITSGVFAQTSFKKGYFIDKQGNKTECFIRDLDWKNTPASFDYKLTEDGVTATINTEEVSEFVAGPTKYIRADIRYDKSPQDIRKLNNFSNPDWTDANVLLRVVEEGKATLYHYSTPNYSLLFLSLDGKGIEQLVYKSYFLPKDPNSIGNNQLYLSQLRGQLQCGDISQITLQRYPYQVRPIAKLVRNFNICSGGVVAEAPTTTKSFALRLTPGINFSQVSVDGPGNYKYVFPTARDLRLGVEVSFTLPFNNGKWVIVAEPTYSAYKETSTSYPTPTTLEHVSLEFPIGVRHRFFLSEKSFIFVNAMGMLEFPIKHTQTYGSSPNGVSLKVGSFGFAGGAGFAFGRLSLEARYYPERNRNQETNAIYHYSKTAVILGFRITK